MSGLPPFRSDNTAGIAPEVVRAIQDANRGECAAYGADEFSARLSDLISTIFERRSWCFPVGSGVAANGLALSVVAPPASTIVCHDAAHIRLNEGGAAEFFTQGARLAPVGGRHGKIHWNELDELARSPLPGGGAGWSTLSLTQLTEAGTVYSPHEIMKLAGIAHSRGARVHMDGARLANAVASLECRPSEITWRAGVDIVSLGATKNGTMNADAVVVFDHELAERLSERIKRTGQVYSKMRFMAAQLLVMFGNELWLRNARHANQMAGYLASRVRQLEGAEIIHPVQGNQIFLRIAPDLVQHLERAGLQLWQSGTDDCGTAEFRLVTSFATTRTQVDDLFSSIERIN